MSCCIHYDTVDNSHPLTTATQNKVGILENAAQQWVALDKDLERSIAARFLNLRQSLQLSELKYHQHCFLRFGSQSKIDKVRNSKRKRRYDPTDVQPLTVAPKLLRSMATVKASGPILPRQCVICGKDKTIRTFDRKRRLEPLSKAETLTAGGLLEAAEVKKDEALLVNIRGDCVAREVQYHRSCHRKYVRAATYTRDSAVDLAPSTSVSAEPTTSANSATDSADSSMDESCMTLPATGPQTQSAQYYHTAMQLRKELADSRGVSLKWPPSPGELTMDRCMQVIPQSLYNFMAVIIGAANDYPGQGRHVTLSPSDQRKVVSLCQDIVYAHSKGSILTPKSAALGLAVRHLTGSSHVTRLLSGLGHTCSYDTVLRMETALAVQKAHSKDQIPDGFQPGTITVLVYDNIDFAEETISGAGTTHHTNGIMFQVGHAGAVAEASQPEIDPVPRRPRSFSPFDSDIRPYFITKKVGPAVLDKPSATSSNTLDRSRSADLMYVLSKTLVTELPGWTQYNISVSKSLPRSRLHYLPVIESSPTELSTVRHLLDSAIAKADQLKCPSVMVVLDQAIYCKAQQICWEVPTLKERLVLRLGEFHTIMCFLSVMGRRFSMSGLEDILVESESVASGSMRGVLSGHMYNRSLRSHKLLFEALGRLLISAFLNSDCCTAEQVATWTEQCHSCPGEPISTFEDQLQGFIVAQSQSSKTFAFWWTYIDMVLILLAFIRATRTCDWELHLSALRAMLPWIFAYDRTNYSRYAPIYWLEMHGLQKTHPWMSHQLQTSPGSWTLQKHEDHGFCSMAADQAIETTVNRESKMSGGIKGITLKPGAVQRWILAQPAKAEITARCDELAGLEDGSGAPHKEGGKLRIARDEHQVMAIQETIHAMLNPWTCGCEDLVSLSSGSTASLDTADDLMSAFEKGESKLTQYMDSRLHGQEESVFATLKTMKLKTFASQPKKAKAGTSMSSVLKADRSTFARLLVVAKLRDLDLRTIFQYSLSAVPAPLSSSDGSGLSKTTKAALLSALEEQCQEATTPTLGQHESVSIQVDVMAYIQSFPCSQIPATFGELSHKLFCGLVALGDKFHASRVDFVGDRYHTISIKNVERDRRSRLGTEKVTIYSPEQKVPKQWSKLMGSSSFKQDLQSFIESHWKTVQSERAATIYLALSEKCFLLRWSGDSDSAPDVATINELSSNHEEADTRLILHAAHALSQGSTPVIWSPDTDVGIIALATISLKDNEDRQVFFATGTGNRRRVVNLSKMASDLGKTASAGLIGLHALTGCDTTSSFYGKGKNTCLKVYMANPDYHQALQELGDKFEMQSEVLSMIESFTCRLYGSSNNSINDTRYEMFCSSTPSEKSLPPTLDSLTQHVRRANYQAAIWRRATDRVIDCPPPTEHGWTMQNTQLTVKWMEQPAAPKEVLKTIHCGCKTSCTNRCSCIRAGLPCTPLCGHTDCANQCNPQMEADLESDSEPDDF